MTYTHSLEKIYAFETINPKSVKAVALKSQAQTFTPHKEPPQQLLFPFGPYFEEALSCFRLNESIASLGLTPFAQKALLSRGIQTVEEACRFLKEPQGLGQGHIEELKSKSEAFLGKDPFKKKKSIHWQSLVRLYCHDLEAKERYALLARFCLQELYPLTTGDLQEVNRSSDEQIEKAQERGKVHIQNKSQDALIKIQEAFVRPWLRKRDHVATRVDIIERLWQISEDPHYFHQIEKFLSFHFELFSLPQPVPDVFASDTHAQDDFLLVLDIVKSYFYHPFVRYPLAQLIHFAKRELPHLPDTFIEKVLSLSPHFVLTLSESGYSEVGFNRAKISSPNRERFATS